MMPSRNSSIRSSAGRFSTKLESLPQSFPPRRVNWQQAGVRGIRSLTTLLGTGVDWMSDHRTIASALRLADGCIRDARLLAKSGSRNAAYLSEQAIEQVVRALATSEAIHIERHDAHQLDKIVRRFPDGHAEITALKSVVWLEAYATTFRYTLPSGQIPRAPDKAKLQKAIDDISNLILRVARHFGVDLGDETKPAQMVAPMRKPQPKE